MLGALAWQATTVIKMILVSRGEIAGGCSIIARGSPPVCPGVLCCVPVTTDPSSGTSFYHRESFMELPTKHQRYNRKFTAQIYMSTYSHLNMRY